MSDNEDDIRGRKLIVSIEIAVDIGRRGNLIMPEVEGTDGARCKVFDGLIFDKKFICAFAKNI